MDSPSTVQNILFCSLFLNIPDSCLCIFFLHILSMEEGWGYIEGYDKEVVGFSREVEEDQQVQVKEGNQVEARR